MTTDHATAVAACITTVRLRGAALIPDLQETCALRGMEIRGIQAIVLADRPNVYWWAGNSDEFCDVIDAILDRERRIRIRRAPVEAYRRWWAYPTIRPGVEMPLADGPIPSRGYEERRWCPIQFVWCPRELRPPRRTTVRPVRVAA